MFLSIKTGPFILASLLAAIGLIGCQSTSVLNPQQVTINTSSINTAPVLSEQVINVENLNRFDWKLVRWIDNQDVVTHVDTAPPLILDVRPSNLVFKYDCQRYSLHHDGYHAYTYTSSGVTTTTPASCTINDTQAASDIPEYLTQLFPEYGRGRFNLKLVSSKEPPPKSSSLLNKLTTKKPIPYELALNTQGNQLIFEGTPKILKPISGLPITHGILKKYQWRLVSAVDRDNKFITEISDLGFPVSAYFGYPVYNEEHHVGFSSDCNGVGGPYILTPDNMLLIGSGAQTMKGCSAKREAAEDKIRQLEQLSKSQLTLQQLSNANVDDTNLPYYLLTQKLNTGETLIWKNQKTVTR